MDRILVLFEKARCVYVCVCLFRSINSDLLERYRKKCLIKDLIEVEKKLIECMGHVSLFFVKTCLMCFLDTHKYQKKYRKMLHV